MEYIEIKGAGEERHNPWMEGNNPGKEGNARKQDRIKAIQEEIKGERMDRDAIILLVSGARIAT